MNQHFSHFGAAVTQGRCHILRLKRDIHIIWLCLESDSDKIIIMGVQARECRKNPRIFLVSLRYCTYICRHFCSIPWGHNRLITKL